jgi:UDP-glucose 4-epimerase
MNILITGGAGYIGTELAHELLEQEEVSHVTIYDNLSRKNYNLFIEQKFDSEKISFIQGDILDGRTLEKALDNIDVVYHLAAKVTTPYTDQELHQYEQVNHWGTTELVTKIKNSDVSKVVFLSSASVYGFSDEPFDEDSPLSPTNHYGITKKRAEKEIVLLNGDRTINIVRSANVFGYSRSMRFDSVINRFMFGANFNNKISVYGDGRQYRAFVSIDYLVHMLANLIFDDSFPTVVNATEFNFSINEVIFEYLKKIYPRLEVLFVNQDLPTNGIKLTSKYDLESYGGFNARGFLEYLERLKEGFSFS